MKFWITGRNLVGLGLVCRRLHNQDRKFIRSTLADTRIYQGVCLSQGCSLWRSEFILYNLYIVEYPHRFFPLYHHLVW